MNKRKSSESASGKKTDILLRSRIQDMADVAYSREIPIYSDFFDIYELSILHSMSRDLPGVQYKVYGGYEFAERQMAMFISDALFNGQSQKPFPITCLEVQPAHKKFAQPLSHRDFLGSLLGLGIERCKIGDIVLKENAYGQSMAYVYCCANMADFFINEWTKVRNTNVKTAVCSEPVQAEIRFKEQKGTVSSLRVDAVVAFAYHLSRSSTVSLFQSQKIFINGKLTESNSSILKEGDMVSVRGYGRFLFEQMLSVTKKDRCFISIKKYG